MSTSIEEQMDTKSSVENAELSNSSPGSLAPDSGMAESSLPPPPTLTVEEERKLWRKIDLRLMPILSLMYLVSFLDRSNIGNARLQGLDTQLDLTGNKFNIALTMFFIPYCTLGGPANIALKRFRPSRWLPGLTVRVARYSIVDNYSHRSKVVWGIVMVAMGFVKTYPALVGTRACLGGVEVGLFPGVAYYLTFWYPRHMLQWRVGLFFGAASLAGAFGGVLAYGISFMGGTGGLLGWSWIFILEGIFTVLVGTLGFFVLVDFPDMAKFLTPEERAFVVQKKKYDFSTVGEESHFEIRHLVAALTDWQVWVHCLILLSAITNLYGITLFLPTIINTFGFNPGLSSLLSTPPFVLAAIVLFVFAHWSDRLKLRFPFIITGFVLSLIGFSINISNAPSGVKYFGTFFCVTGAYAPVPGIIAWCVLVSSMGWITLANYMYRLANNLSGQEKRGVGIALQIGVAHFGGTFASNMYRTQDKPRYLVGHGCELMFVAIGLISRENSRREGAMRVALERGENELYSEKVGWRKMGDRAPNFRYTL
ncbi:MFS general substrate transporter [Mycena metata]|uniref:MFS general substrate transporter n=1 Tax=Mycena metata TaxID=1033252 RepID=A0AAD7NHN1_9AGAR|nr:MFS general substrate transporter [Mycena metata]